MIARSSLSHYEADKELIDQLAMQTAEYIKDKENYRKFIEEFYDKKRTEKPLSLETLGNYQNTSLSDNHKISFKTKNHYFDYTNKIISNGYGISIDDEFNEII